MKVVEYNKKKDVRERSRGGSWNLYAVNDSQVINKRTYLWNIHEHIWYEVKLFYFTLLLL